MMFLLPALLRVLALGPPSASSSSPSSTSTQQALASSSSLRSTCRPIPASLPLCYGVGYRLMRLPNLLGHGSLREAQQQAAAWLPLLSKRCHPDTSRFLCSLFAPVCGPELGEPVSPCRSLCEAVRDGCLPVMSAFGFPWPEMFECSRFPSGTELCVPPATGGQQSVPTEEEEAVRREGALVGSVICDACSLVKEGEADVQEKFCLSPYAFKMRLGSVSTVGGDRQLVPTARSRILRWAGGGAQRAEGVGGAMAHSALWLPEGGSCTCPGLDSQDTGEDEDQRPAGDKDGGEARAQGAWFLGLARPEEGRLVLTQLLRWTRGDKELKKLVRTLLRLPCPDRL